MKQTHHIGYVQTPSVKNLSNVKNALVENGLVPLTTPNEMLPDAIEKGLKAYNKDFGMIHEGKYRIRYFDIDGTILKIEYVAEGGKLTPPAKTPNYDPDYLIFDEWNYDIENYVVEHPTDVGATYNTVDDATYMFCRFTNETGLNPTLAISGVKSIDWGDGTIDANVSHTYAKEGEYLIKLIAFNDFTTTSSKYLFGSILTSQCLLKFYIGNGLTTLKNFLCGSCTSLSVISIPNSVGYARQGAFREARLNVLILPKELKSLDLSSLEYNDLEFISIPNNYVLALGTSGSCFKLCRSLKEIVIPTIYTKNLASDTFYNCSGLKTVIISKTITGLNSNCFYGCNSLKDFIILSENVPTISSSTFSGCSNITFWVNDDIIKDLKVAANWSKYASQMKPLSWYPSLTDPNAE